MIRVIARYLLVFICFIGIRNLYSCSMFKITEGGKTMVGNNEDWISANAEIWFEPAANWKFGVAYLGFMNHFPQGAINEAGLVFDVFVTDYLAVEDTIGKRKVSPLVVTLEIMRNLENVRQVKAYFEKIDLSYMAGGMYMFVDQSGEYLIVEGDILTLGNKPYYLQSNFIPSVNPVPELVENVKHYQAGRQFLKEHLPRRTTNYCADVMNSMRQESTQYTSIYDLNSGIISLYHFHNYEHVVHLNLNEELGKGKHTLVIPELFPDTTAGFQYYTKYNDASHPDQFMKDLWEKDSEGKQGEELDQFKEGFSWVLNNIGQEWLNDKQNTTGAIAIFEYGVQLFPETAKIYKNLGEAYLRKQDYSAAIRNYAYALYLNPESFDVIRKLQKIEAHAINE